MTRLSWSRLIHYTLSTFISTTTTTCHILHSPIITAEISKWPRFRPDSLNTTVAPSSLPLSFPGVYPSCTRIASPISWTPDFLSIIRRRQHYSLFLQCSSPFHLSLDFCSPIDLLYQSTSLNINLSHPLPWFTYVITLSLHVRLFIYSVQPPFRYDSSL